MTSLELIPISDIGLGERLRPVDVDQAGAIAFSIEQSGLINPINVRRTPAAKTGKFTLIAGAHRLEAYRILGREMIDAIIVKADGEAAEALEIAENFFRNDLSAIDRAAFGERFRQLWEMNVGPIASRKKKDSQSALAPIFHGRFKDAVAKRLGVSDSAAKRLHRIATGLHPRLRDMLRGTPEADNESLLLKLVRMGTDEQIRIAAAMDAGAKLKTAVQTHKVVKADKMPKDPETDFLLWVWKWSSWSKEQRQRFLSQTVQPEDWDLEPDAPVTVAEPTAPAKQPRKPVKPVRKSSAGRKPDDPKVKREKTFRKLFITELAEQLLPTKLAIDAPHVAYLREQPPENQYVAACWIGNGHGHDLDDLKTKIDREKDDAAEWYATRNAETADHAPLV
jgi:ParB family chromosome partitioning protein